MPCRLAIDGIRKFELPSGHVLHCPPPLIRIAIEQRRGLGSERQLRWKSGAWRRRDRHMSKASTPNDKSDRSGGGTATVPPPTPIAPPERGCYRQTAPPGSSTPPRAPAPPCGISSSVVLWCFQTDYFAHLSDPAMHLTAFFSARSSVVTPVSLGQAIYSAAISKRGPSLKRRGAPWPFRLVGFPNRVFRGGATAFAVRSCPVCNSSSDALYSGLVPFMSSLQCLRGHWRRMFQASVAASLCPQIKIHALAPHMAPIRPLR